MKIKRQIVYRPKLSVADNAAINKCSEATIRKYIRENRIDRRADNKTVIRSIIENHQEALTVAEIMRATGLSRVTVKKYLQQKEKRVQADKVSAFDKRYIRNLIGSVSDDQGYILNSIIQLYNNGQSIDADLTYSKGEFYRHVTPPIYKFDKFPLEGIEGVRDLAETDDQYNIYNSIVYDLPYNIQSGHTNNLGKIKTRFTHFSSLSELYSVNQEMLQRAHRLLCPKGMLVVKVQDTCYANQQVWVRQFVENEATKMGLRKLDEFVLIKQTPMGNRGTEQHHARRQHSYFLVFCKRKAKTIKSIIE